jgi:hypothetical protein
MSNNGPGRPIPDINYHEVEIPDPSKKPKPEWTMAERRAYILDRMIEEAGPHGINQAQIAKDFDMAKSTIHNDLQRIAEYAAESNTREFYSHLDFLFRGAIRNLTEDGEWLHAARVGKEWAEFLADRGAIAQAPKHMQLDANVKHEGTESEDYVVIPDDDAGGIVAETPDDAPDDDLPETVDATPHGPPETDTGTDTAPEGDGE